MANRSCVEEEHQAFALLFHCFFAATRRYELEVSKPRVITKTVKGFDRMEVAEIPIDALREIIVNSFAHANYVLWSKNEIDVFPNRISIDNPGAFPDDLNPEDSVERTVASRLRNEFICDALYKYGYVETWGTGLAKAYSLCFEAGIRCGYEKGDGFWFIFHRNVIGSRTRSTPTLTNSIK